MDFFLGEQSLSAVSQPSQVEYQKQSPIRKREKEYLQGSFQKKRKLPCFRVKGRNKIVNAYREKEKEGGLSNHFPGIPEKRNLTKQGIQMEQGQKQFAGKHAPQIGHNAEPGDSKQYKANAKNQGGGILQEGGTGAAKAVQDAACGGGQIQKRAEPGKNPDKTSCRGIVKYAGSQGRAE